jgi:hypothetical protein
MTTTNKTLSYYKSTRKDFNEINLLNTVVEDFDINFELLKEIMYQQAPTGTKYEEIKKEYLLEVLRKITDPNNTVITESNRNIYITKGVNDFYPTVVAHYDTAQDYHESMDIMVSGNWMFGFNQSEGEQCGIGADDSVGVYFALEMLIRLPVCKVAFFFGEERGCLGSAVADMAFFENSSIVTQLDRRSYTNDFIYYTNGVTTFSSEHYTVINPLLEKYNYQLNQGSCTDVGKLRQKGLKVCSHNLSCGYFNEHTNSEVIHIPSMNNALMLAYELLQTVYNENLVLTFPIPEPPKKNSYFKEDNDYGFDYYSSYSNYPNYSGYDNDYVDENGNYKLFPEPKENNGNDFGDGYAWNEEFGIMTKDGKITSMYFRDFFPLLEGQDLLYEFSEKKVYPKEEAKALVENDEMDQVFYTAYYKESYSDFQDLLEKDEKEILECTTHGVCPCCGSNSLETTYHLQINTVECNFCHSTFYVDFDMLSIEDLPDDRHGTLYIDNY